MFEYLFATPEHLYDKKTYVPERGVLVSTVRTAGMPREGTACETMIFRADNTGKVTDFLDLFDERYDADTPDAELDTLHDAVVERLRSGAISLTRSS